MNMVSKSDGKRALTVWLSFNWLLLLLLFSCYIVDTVLWMRRWWWWWLWGEKHLASLRTIVTNVQLFLETFCFRSLHLLSSILFCCCAIAQFHHLVGVGVCVCCVFVRFNYILVPSPSYKVYIIKTSRWRMGIWLVFPSLTPNGVQFEK